MTLSWRRHTPALVLVAALAANAAFAGEDDPVWITLGGAHAKHLQAALSRAGRGDVLEVESAGDVVVARTRSGALGTLAALLHAERQRCGGFVAHADRDEAYAAVERDRALAAALPPASAVYTVDNAAVVTELRDALGEANIRATIGSLAAFFTRYHGTPTGLESAEWIRAQWAGFAAGRADVTVEMFSHPLLVTRQPSVILTIPGTTLPDEIVVLGAHQDSINGSGATNRAPGADDDASGVAALSEVIRVALARGYRPQRTVKFMAYAAEEVGLRGSADIAQQFRNADRNVAGVLQLDMTNYKGSPAQDIVLITDRTDAGQNGFLAFLIQTYLPGLAQSTSQCGYGCSDHASWYARGYPASFPFESLIGDDNPNIHTANDTLAASGGDARHALKFAKLAAAYMAELAKGSLAGAGGEVFADDFEVDLGWTVNRDGGDTARRGKWAWGNPAPTADGGGPKQLGTTSSGKRDLSTARAAGATAATNDVDRGLTSIESPPIVLPASGTLSLSFRYYLAHDAAAASADAFRAFVVVGAARTKVFESLGIAANRNGVWTAATANLDAFRGQTVRLRFEAADPLPDGLVEAGVDDVEVTQQ